MNAAFSRTLAVLPLLALVACGDDDVSTSPRSPAGHAYVATGASGFDLPAASHLRIEFQADQLGVSGGCNQIGGGYSIDDGALVVDQLIQTEMACDEPLMQLDTDVVALLSAEPAISLDGETLTIAAGDTSLTLEQEQPAEDLPLEGTVWTVTTIVEGDSATGGFAVQPTLTFHDGTVDVFAGCNSGSGEATVADTSIEFGPIATTKMACEPDVMDVENGVLAVLTGSLDYQIEGSMLTLLGDGAGLQLEGAAG